jgi:lipopolysaccharide transport system ATP-binding protein
MHKTEIEAKFEEIVNFAGIGRFLDTPVKRYSSGMYVRLAFSVAAHLDPEILIVDEVLAVGDVAFQKKCLGKMEEACTRSRTVLFVSHNLAAVEALCSRVVVLRQGSVVFNGTTKEGLEYYLQGLSGKGTAAQSHIVDLSCAASRPAKFPPLLKRLELYTGDGKPLLGELPTGAPLRARICFDLEDPCESFDIVLGFDTLSGQRICVAHSACESKRVHEQRVGEQAFVCEIPSLPLAPGEFRVTVALQISRKRSDFVADAARLTVIKADYFGTGFLPPHGMVLIQNHWTLEKREVPVVAAAVNESPGDRWG